MKKIYSILFCLMAMSITFSSCSKGGDDDFLPNGGGTEVNETLTDNDIVSLNDAYNTANESGNITIFINALETKKCIEKVAQTRGGDSDGKYVLTDKGKNDYFKSDLFSIIDDWEKVYDRMCLVFQGYWSEEIKHDDEYKWVSLDNPNNDYFEFSNTNEVYYSRCLIIKHPIITDNEEYYINKLYFDEYKPTYTNGEEGEFKLPFQNHIEGVLFFSYIRGAKNIVRSDGNYISPKDNICIMHVSSPSRDWGLYIRVPKTNK